MPKDADGNEIVDESVDTDVDADADVDTDADTDADADNDGDIDADDAGTTAAALTEALAQIEDLAAQIADLTNETVRLRAVNSTLLVQIPADEDTDEIDGDDIAGDDEKNYDSVDDALAAHKIERE